MNKRKSLLTAIIISLIACFFIFDLGQYLTLDFFQSQKNQLLDYRNNAPYQAAFIYFLIYVAITALSLPAAAIVTLAGGAIFGVVEGTLLVSFASTIGATCSFLIARTLLRETVEKRFSTTFRKINAGVKKEGALYLFGLRLVPVFPFFAVNLLMGLTQMPVRRFFIVSQLGMLPGTIVYVNAGTQIAQLDSLGDIASPGLLFSFALLGLLPLISKRLLDFIKARKIYRPYDRPKHFDTNMVVIGAGSAGLVSAYIAAAVKAKVTLIEKGEMGGDCLNTGCVPSKAFIRSAAAAHQIRQASDFGIETSAPTTNFSEVMSRIQKIIDKVAPHDSVERYQELGVDCVSGEGKILDPYRVSVNDKVITTRSIVIATGGRPAVPDIDGLELCPYYTSDTIWSLKQQPKNLLVIGAGPIGCELAQSFRRLGSQVTLVNRSEHMLPKEDSDVSELVKEQFQSEGILLYLGAKPLQVQPSEEQDSYVMALDYQGTEERIEFDCLLLAVGRNANTQGFGLENLDIEFEQNGTVTVNEYLQTRYPNIFACGDVAGPYQLTHAASHQAWYVAVNSLFGRFKKLKVDYRVIPWSTFTDPEVARVGLSETEAKSRDIDYEVTAYSMNEVDRAIADGSENGFVKVLTRPGSDKILGACIVGKHAGDLLAEFVMAMKHGLGLNKILGTIHTYPTLMELNKAAAGEWKRNHTPALAMTLLPRFHKWQRKD